MTDVASPEDLKVSYSNMSPDVHRAVGCILNTHADESFRVDYVQPHEIEGIREVLCAAEGSRLPAYHYDKDGEYIRMGSTPLIEERHTRVALNRQESDQGSLWLRVPRFSQDTPAPVEETKNEENFTKKDLAILGGGGLAVNGLIFAGAATNKPGLAIAATIADMPLAVYALHRIRQVIPPYTAQA